MNCIEDKREVRKIKDPAIVCGKFQIPFWIDGFVSFHFYEASVLRPHKEKYQRRPKG
jgi:hypothetical protein